MPILLLLLLFLVACSDPDAGDRAATWVVGPDPVLEIGVMDGDPDRQFSQILAVLELDDGRIVVADGRAPDGALRLFSADGAFLDRTLPAGEGPREAQTVRWAGIVEGGIGVWDSGLRRLSVVDVDAEGFVWRESRPLALVHPEPQEPAPDTQLMLQFPPQLLGVLSDGSFVGLPQSIGGGRFGERTRFENAIYRWDADGTPMGEIRTVATAEVTVPDVTAGQSAPPSTPFPYRLAVRLHEDRILLGTDTRGFVIEILSPEGEVEETLDWEGGSRAVTPELQSAWLEEQEVEEATFPEVHAPFRSIRVAEDGHYWIGGEVLPGQAEFWHVLDPEGAYLGRVPSPGRFVAHRITGSEMLGVYTDDFDVQYVRRYPIQ